MDNSIKKILIVRTDRIGDVILTTPALAALRAHYPQAHITLLVAPLAYELVNHNPNVNEVLIDERGGKHAGLAGFWRLVQGLRKRHYDLAINYHTKRRSNLACFLAGIPKRLGYKNNKYGFLLNYPVIDKRHLGKKHEAQYCLDLLTKIGVSNGPLTLDVSVQEDAQQWAQQWFDSQQFQSDQAPVAFHLGASDPSKRWPTHHFKELMEILIAKYNATIILVGTSEYSPTASKLSEILSGFVFDLTGKTTLSQLVSLFRRCKMLVSNDSGPVHVAAAAGIPVVSIFTRNQAGINPQRWRPLGPLSQVVAVEFDPSPSFEKAGSADPRYLEKIPPKAVLEAVDAIYKLC